MQGPLILFGQGTAAVTYHRLGFCAAYVKVMGEAEEDINEWFLLMPAGDSIETVDTTGVRTLDTSDGITLVQFNDAPGSLPGSGGTPTSLENAEWYKANGIAISASCAAIQDGIPYIVMAFPIQVPVIRAVHDGGDTSHTYCQDSSIDFKEAGVSGGQQFIVINETNDNYAYVKAVQKPAGQAKYCRLTTSDSAGTATSAADFDDDDVLFVLPKDWVQSPLSGIGAMT